MFFFYIELLRFIHLSADSLFNAMEERKTIDLRQLIRSRDKLRRRYLPMVKQIQNKQLYYLHNS